jgi:CRP/FNR family cyclic AMP-dependent transcriptional regulator
MAQIHLADFHPEMSLFDALEPAAFRKLLGIARRETVEAGSALLREGGEADTLSIILAGKVKVYKTGDNLEPIELAQLGSGSIFGEMGVFDGQVASATIIATEDTIVLQIGRQRFFDFLHENPDIGITLMHTMIYILSNRLRKANVHATSVASTNPDLATAITNLLGD